MQNKTNETQRFYQILNLEYALFKIKHDSNNKVKIYYYLFLTSYIIDIHN